MNYLKTLKKPNLSHSYIQWQHSYWIEFKSIPATKYVQQVFFLIFFAKPFQKVQKTASGHLDVLDFLFLPSCVITLWRNLFCQLISHWSFYDEIISRGVFSVCSVMTQQTVATHLSWAKKKEKLTKKSWVKKNSSTVILFSTCKIKHKGYNTRFPTCKLCCVFET